MQTVGELDDQYAQAPTQIVTNLLRIIPKAAAFSPDSRRDRADRAALGLSTYLSDPGHCERFMDMNGPDTSNLGEVNPELLHATSRGLVGCRHRYGQQRVGNPRTRIERRR